MTEPDPNHMTTFCNENVVVLLHEACGVDVELAEQIGADILKRAHDFSELERADRDVLCAPFVEECAHHEPRSAPLWLKAAATVVVRNSLLEEAHANGPVESGGLHAVTEFATGPLSHLLAARDREPVGIGDQNQFAGLATQFPRAWSALSALAATVSDGGRMAYRLPAGTALELPEQSQHVIAPTKAESEHTTILSAIDPRIDQYLLATLQGVADGTYTLSWVPKVSHYSRAFSKLLWVLEFILSHGANVMTTNYLIRSNDVWVRRRVFVRPTELDPREAYRDLTGLVGAHRQTVEDFLRQL
ncbi:hypothetical protein [Kribbella sp. NPDC050459]|uniref:hypothetical protein n=1 Tax=Kribbella sp. NPDC050459 TaxID=3155785 RepID=UPI0033EBEE2F